MDSQHSLTFSPAGHWRPESQPGVVAEETEPMPKPTPADLQANATRYLEERGVRKLLQVYGWQRHRTNYTYC